VGCLTVDNTPIPMDSTPTDSLDLSHVTVRSISNRRFSIPIKVETVENTEEITALTDSGAEGLFIDKSIAHKWRTSILKSLIKVRNVDGTYNESGAITERCLIPFRINDKIMTEWFYVTTLGDQNLILGLPWLEKHNPIIDWTEKTLEFRNSQEDKAKAFIRSLAQEQEETTLIEDKDLVVRYLKSHRGPEPSDQLYTPFEDIGRWNEEQPDIAIRKYLAADVEHLYDAAIDDVRANQYGVIPKNENPMDLIYMKYTHPLTTIAPDRSHTIELINNVQDKTNDLAYYINKLSDLAETIQRNTKWTKKVYLGGAKPQTLTGEVIFNIEHFIADVENDYHGDCMTPYRRYAANPRRCIHCQGTHASEDHHLSVSIPIVSNSGHIGLSPPQEQTQTNTDNNTSHKHKNTRFATTNSAICFHRLTATTKTMASPSQTQPPTPSRRLRPGPPPPHPPGSHGLPPLPVAYPLRCHHIHTARYPPSSRARARSDSRVPP
jgi:hypothetical protein